MADQQASHGEIETRVDYMLQLILDGFGQSEAVNAAHVNTLWGRDLSKRWLRELYQRAQQRLADEVRHVDRRALLMQTHARYEALFREAREAGDRRDAMAVLDRMVALWHLNVADALEPSWEAELIAAGHDPGAVKDNVIKLIQSGEHENVG